MVDLRKTPGLQHTVALMTDTVAGTVLNLERLDAAKISISLNPGRRLFKPMMEGRPVDWAVRMCKLEKPHNVDPNIGLVEAFAPYAAGKAVPWFNACEKHFYPISSGVVVPVQPSGYLAEDGRLKVLWVQSWKGRTLDPLQKSIFNTILRDTFFVGDFKDAPLEWLDLREHKKGQGREIEVLTGDEMGTVSRADLVEYMRILLAAFEQYSAAKAARKAAEKAEAAKQKAPRPTPLFPDEL